MKIIEFFKVDKKKKMIITESFTFYSLILQKLLIITLSCNY